MVIKRRRKMRRISIFLFIFSIPGIIYGNWQETTSLPIGLMIHASVVWNGYVYTMGGHTGGLPNDHDRVYYAKFNSDGTIPDSGAGTWVQTTSLPAPRTKLSAAVWNGYVYAIGGGDEWSWTNVYNTVWYAKIDTTTGELGGWSTTASFPIPRYYFHASVVVTAGKPYLYVIAGWGGSSSISSVCYAEIQSDGSISGWQTTTPLPNTKEGLISLTYNGYLYAIAGSPNYQVYYAEPDSNGAIPAWIPTENLPLGKCNLGGAVCGGKFFTTAGQCFTPHNVVYCTTPNADGTLNPWASCEPLPVNNFYHTSEAWNGYLYVIGGWQCTDKVWYIECSCPTGVEETQTPNHKTQILVYPNPATRAGVRFQLSGISVGVEHDTPSLQIHDLSGRLVKSLPITDYRLPITIKWDCRDGEGRKIESGVYFYHIEHKGTEIAGKFIILTRR